MSPNHIAASWQIFNFSEVSSREEQRAKSPVYGKCFGISVLSVVVLTFNSRTAPGMIRAFVQRREERGFLLGEIIVKLWIARFVLDSFIKCVVSIIIFEVRLPKIDEPQYKNICSFYYFAMLVFLEMVKNDEAETTILEFDGREILWTSWQNIIALNWQLLGGLFLLHDCFRKNYFIKIDIIWTLRWERKISSYSPLWNQ